MKYLQPSFTLPTAPPRISEEDYEIAVGLRCPKCRDRWIGTDTGYLPICGCFDGPRITNIQVPEVPEALKPLTADVQFHAIPPRRDSHDLR